MLNKSDDNTRRILSFPAVRPCESVSFPILLSSLLNLGRRICSFKSRTFLTNQKNAHTSIHLIQTLIVFLEEIPNPNPRSELSTVLCLSELHFILQKIHFLLEDCARDDSRLWMLSKCEKSATYFRVLVRAIAVALDVLPLGEIEVVDEVKELVEFVRKQGLRISFEVGKDDRRAMMGVSRILEQFERGIVPESRDLKRVLDYLGISSWSECNREIKFLENEIGHECSNSDKRDFGSLCSLAAFLIYCRCSVFTNIEKNSVLPQCSGDWSSGSIMLPNSDDFRCPITLEIMIDPVTISTGHTYDRSSIQKWFACGNHTCPKTGEKLKSLDLVPNLAVKRIIKKYLQGNGTLCPQSDGCRQIRPLLSGAGSPAADQAITMAAHSLVGRLFSGTEQEQSKAAYEIRLLTKTSDFNRSCLVETHAIPHLLALIASTNPEGQENAAAALLNLSKHPKTKILLCQSGALDQIIDLLQNGLKIEARQHAAGVLFYLASVEENRRKIGRIAIPGLMGLLDNGSTRGKKNALVTLLALLMCHENHWRVLSGGVVLMIVNLLTSCERDDLNLITDCLAVLAILAEKIEGAMAIVSSGGVSVILEILGSSVSRAAKEHCVSLLLALCVNDGVDVVPVLVKDQSLMVTLYSLLTGGSARSSRKAGSLIRILHGFNEKSSNGSTMAAAQEQFVHVW